MNVKISLETTFKTVSLVTLNVIQFFATVFSEAVDNAIVGP